MPGCVYRHCIVPKCISTTVKTPGKHFICVPINEKRRRRWFKAMGKFFKKGSRSSQYVCEDHFDLENDMENYMRWKLTGCNKMMKRDVVPHIFDCQPGRKRAFTSKPRETTLKRIRKKLVEEALAAYSKTTATETEPEIFGQYCLLEDFCIKTEIEESPTMIKQEFNPVTEEVKQEIQIETVFLPAIDKNNPILLQPLNTLDTEFLELINNNKDFI